MPKVKENVRSTCGPIHGVNLSWGPAARALRSLLCPRICLAFALFSFFSFFFAPHDEDCQAGRGGGLLSQGLKGRFLCGGRNAVPVGASAAGRQHQ